MNTQIKQPSRQNPARPKHPEALTSRSCVRENAAESRGEVERSAAFLRPQRRGQTAARPKSPRRNGTRQLFLALLAACLLGTTALAGGADANPNVTPDASSRNTAAEEAKLESPTPRREPDDKDPKKFEKVMGMTIGLVAVVMGIGIAFFVIWHDYRRRHQIVTACHQERMMALEKGLELPPYPQDWMSGPPNDPTEPHSPIKGLKAGVFWLVIGVGTLVFLSLQTRPGLHPSASAIPIAIGVAYFICYSIETRKPRA